MEQRYESRVTIGMPVYNAESYIDLAIDSIRAQGFSDWRLVVCDNASTDRTVEIARARAAADPRISVVVGDVNRGQVGNFGWAFEANRSPLFMWMSDDDLIEPTYLERCVGALDADPELIGAYTAGHQIDGRGEPMDPFVDGPRPGDRTDPDPAVRLREALIAEPALCFFGVYRADVLARTDLLGPFVGSDRVLVGHLALLGPIRQLPERLFHRRTHDTSYSHAAFSNRRKFESYCGRPPGRLRPLGVERIFRMAGIVQRAELSPSERKDCYRVVLVDFGRMTVNSQIIMSLRTVSGWLTARTGRKVELHRVAVGAAKRVVRARPTGTSRS